MVLAENKFSKPKFVFAVVSLVCRVGQRVMLMPVTRFVQLQGDIT